MIVLPIVVVGAAGCGRQTLDVIDAVNRASPKPVYQIMGVVDDAPSDDNLRRLAARETPYLGDVDSWLAADEGPWQYSIGIGDPEGRAQMATRFEATRHRAATLVDPSAGLGSQVTLGEGVVIRAGAQLSTNVRLGRHSYINLHATIGHDTTCGDFVSVNPGALVSGECEIGDRTLIGAGAFILQGLIIGSNVTVGALACVTRSVPDSVTVKGVPGRW